MNNFSDESLFWDDLIIEAFQISKASKIPKDLKSKAWEIIKNYVCTIKNHLYSLSYYVNTFDIFHFWTIFHNNIMFFSDVIFSVSKNRKLKEDLINFGIEKWKDILSSPIPNNEGKSFLNIFESNISSFFSQSNYDFNNLFQKTRFLLTIISQSKILKESSYTLSLLYSKCNFLINHHSFIPELSDNFVNSLNQIRKGIQLLYYNPNPYLTESFIVINEALYKIQNEFKRVSTIKNVEYTALSIIKSKEFQDFTNHLKKIDEKLYCHFYILPTMNCITEFFKSKFKISFNSDFMKSTFNQENFKSKLLPEFEEYSNYILQQTPPIFRPKILQMCSTLFMKQQFNYFDESVDIFNPDHLKVLRQFWKYIKYSYKTKSSFKLKIVLHLCELENPTAELDNILAIAKSLYDIKDEPYFFSAIKSSFSLKEDWKVTFTKSIKIVPKLFSMPTFKHSFIIWSELQTKSLDFQPQSELFFDAFKCYLIKNQNQLNFSFIQFLLDKITPFLSSEVNNEVHFTFKKIQSSKNFDILCKDSFICDYFNDEKPKVVFDMNKIIEICLILFNHIKSKEKATFNQLFEEAKIKNSNSQLNRLEVSIALNLLSDKNKITIQSNPRLYFVNDSADENDIRDIEFNTEIDDDDEIQINEEEETKEKELETKKEEETKEKELETKKEEETKEKELETKKEDETKVKEEETKEKELETKKEEETKEKELETKKEDETKEKELETKKEVESKVKEEETKREEEVKRKEDDTKKNEVANKEKVETKEKEEAKRKEDDNKKKDDIIKRENTKASIKKEEETNKKSYTKKKDDITKRKNSKAQIKKEEETNKKSYTKKKEDVTKREDTKSKIKEKEEETKKKNDSMKKSILIKGKNKEEEIIEDEEEMAEEEEEEEELFEEEEEEEEEEWLEEEQIEEKPNKNQKIKQKEEQKKEPSQKKKESDSNKKQKIKKNEEDSKEKNMTKKKEQPKIETSKKQKEEVIKREQKLKSKEETKIVKSKKQKEEEITKTQPSKKKEETKIVKSKKQKEEETKREQKLKSKEQPKIAKSKKQKEEEIELTKKKQTKIEKEEKRRKNKKEIEKEESFEEESMIEEEEEEEYLFEEEEEEEEEAMIDEEEEEEKETKIVKKSTNKKKSKIIDEEDEEETKIVTKSANKKKKSKITDDVDEEEEEEKETKIVIKSTNKKKGKSKIIDDEDEEKETKIVKKSTNKKKAKSKITDDEDEEEEKETKIVKKSTNKKKGKSKITEEEEEEEEIIYPTKKIKGNRIKKEETIKNIRQNNNKKRNYKKRGK